MSERYKNELNYSNIKYLNFLTLSQLGAIAMKCSGFLFDLDGTLVNSLPAVEKCWLMLGKRYNFDKQYVLNNIHGRKAIDSIQLLLPFADKALVQKEYDWMEQLEAQELEGITEISGAANFLHKINELNISWAIVTSGTKLVATARHKAANLPMPKVFITGNDVTNSKPAPDGYLLGAKALNLKPEQCIVFEDAIAGVKSAANAHCKVIGINVPNDHEINDKIGIRIHSFDQLIISKDENNEVKITKK